MAVPTVGRGASTSFWVSVLAAAVSAAPQQRAGELVVKLEPGASASTALVKHGCTVAEEVPELGLALVRFHASRDTGELAAALAREPGVEYAHPNFLGRGGLVPEDTFYAGEWHHRNTGQTGGTPGADVRSEEAWELTRGSRSVVVAVLDTGIAPSHPEFAGRLLQGHDFVDEDHDPTAEHPHGVWITGILAANADNDFGVAGMDHECRILPVRVLGANNTGTTFDLVQGLAYAAPAANVVNLSLVGYPPSQSLSDALQWTQEAGVTIVASAGNGGIGDADASWPGASPYTISVGGTQDDDTRATFSGTGSALDVVAPGRNIATVEPDPASNGVSVISGSSAAAPIVAGIAALLYARDPFASPARIRELILESAADGVGDPGEDVPGWDPYYGHGRVDARAALDLQSCEVSRYCSPAAPSASGAPVRLDCSGVPSVSVNDLVFVVQPLLDVNTGLVAYSPDQASLPLGNGTLCLGSATLGFVIRLPGAVPVGGQIVQPLDVESPPTPEGRITGGSTWNFQVWYRDLAPGGTGFNFSDALSVTFCP